MPEDEKDICPECRNAKCFCYAFGFGVPETVVSGQSQHDSGAQFDAADRVFQKRVRKALDSPVGTNLDIFG